MGLLDGFLSLRDDTNKVPDKTMVDGTAVNKEEEPTDSLDDSELLELAKGWESTWIKETKELKTSQEENRKYWLGNQNNNETIDGKGVSTDNRIFMALETFLPIATRQNPDPVVDGGDNEQAKEVANATKNMLVYQADQQRLKLKIKSVVRNWALDLLGVMKIGWDAEIDDIETLVIKTKNIILDPDASVCEGVEYNGKYIGEIKKDSASGMIKDFPKHKALITKRVDGKLGTKLQYQEWWTQDMVFWRFQDTILDRSDNPHWNEETTEEVVDKYGIMQSVPQKGMNHFKKKRMPYIFLSIFNTGDHPWDDTNLIQQNLPLQDVVDKRMKQIDKNTDNLNGGAVFSGDHFTKEQATQAQKALRNGDGVWVPSGDVNTAYIRDSGASLPSDVFNNLQDTRNEIDNIFGTHGTTRGERGASETATGRLTLKQGDESRIGGGVSEYIEQYADMIFNWWVQMMYVYYDEERTGTVIGEEQKSETFKIQSSSFAIVDRLSVSVKEGSLIPKDDVTKRNEAIALWQANAISILDLYIALKVPDPKKSTERWIMQQTNPMALVQDVPQDPQEQLMQQLFAQQSPTGGVIGQAPPQVQ